MNCNNIEDISASMCNKICNDNVSASNTDKLTSCNTKCNDKILSELNPLDITNNFIFLNSADITEDALETSGEQSQDIYDRKNEEIYSLIANMEKEIQIRNSDCGIRIGVKWIKIMDGSMPNQFIDINYIKKFKKYSAFGLKWKNVGNTKPDDTKYIKLVNDDIISIESYNYLNEALISGNDGQGNIILNKKALIDNNLFQNDDTGDLKIYPNSYIQLTDNSYCIVNNYVITINDAAEGTAGEKITAVDNLISIFNSGDDNIDLSLEEHFKNAFLDLTADDFIINDTGDIYIPAIGCSEFTDMSCVDIQTLLSENENCMVDNNDNRYIKRKDTIPYLFHYDAGTECTTSALNFDNKNELFDIVNVISNDIYINSELNEMMGKYDYDKYEKIKVKINEILTNKYSQYFSTNDFLSLFNNNIKYWITIDDTLFQYRSYRYNKANISTGKETDQPTGTYDVNSEIITNNYDEIAKILYNYIPAFPSSNSLIQLQDNDIDRIETLFHPKTILNLEQILDLPDYFNIIDKSGNSTKVILYKPLYEHIYNRDYIYLNSYLNFNDWSSKSGVDFYEHLNDDQKKIDVNINGSYGQIGESQGFYNNVILSPDYITKTECEAIKLNAENTSNTIFLNENIENRHNLPEYRLNDSNFTDVNDELIKYNKNIEKLNKCIENSKTMINLDTYKKTKEYNNINQKITNNAEVNKKYNIYLPKVNKYDGLQTDCKFLSEYNNKDTCGISGQMCLSNDFISDRQYDTELQTKKDSLKSYIFNRQKNYYVGKNTKTDEHYKWQITTDYPNIGLELVNKNLTDLLDTKFDTAINSIITLTDDDLSTIQIDPNIDNNTYVISAVSSRYYIVNLQQEDCNQPNDYVLQNSVTICGQDKQCAYENEYNTSISEISQYDDNLCTNKYNYLEECYNQDPDFVMGKQVDYSTCEDDITSSPQIIDCCDEETGGTPSPECAENLDCGEGSYITYEIENGRYTCEKVCGTCPPNTTLDSSDDKCHANIGYYYDYDYDKLESTNAPIPQQCDSGSYINFTGATTETDCIECDPVCDTESYETSPCTYSTKRVCTELPDNSTKNETNDKDFICNLNYFKRGDQCVKCPDDTTSVAGSLSIFDCIANAGHYFDPSSTESPVEASECSDGSYCTSGATDETPCPEHTTSVAGSSDITHCYAKPGFFYKNAIHDEGQPCSTGHYCLGGPDSTTQDACPPNTYNSLPRQTNVDACIPCEYETSSQEGSHECTDCPTISQVSDIGSYKYYNYLSSGCVQQAGNCMNDLIQDNTNCPTDISVQLHDGTYMNKKQFTVYAMGIERDVVSGKPLLKHVNDENTETPIELTNKLIDKKYILDLHVKHICNTSCISCLPNEKFVGGTCNICEDNKVADSLGTSCIQCHERDNTNTIYDSALGDCTSCSDYQLPDFELNICENPKPGYYVDCTESPCIELEATVNHIVLGQINKADMYDNIKSIIFDYDQQSMTESIGFINDIYIIFRNVPVDESNAPVDESNVPVHESSTDYEDKTLNLTKKEQISNNKYYKDISQNIIIFENDTPTSGDFLIKFMESIYISDSITVLSLPNRLILQTENDSYYLLTHRMQQDINDRYSTTTSYLWEGSYLIFDMNLNITNEQYLCPENTYVDSGISQSAQSGGTNRNICKFYDSGYYRDTYESFSDGDDSSLSSATTIEEQFTNYESRRIQTSCLNAFDDIYKTKIDTTESILGAESGGDYAGCVYKCNTQGHYYNEGATGMEDNKCELCPIGYKCDDLETRTACHGQEYQNETGQNECKTIPTHGTAILDDGGANIGFSVPAGKKYNNVNNTITDCSVNTYKNTPSVINNLDTEREIICDSCPPNNTTTKGVEGSTELAQCIPNFGYTLDTANGQVTTSEGYDDLTGSIQCASGYYLGDFDCETSPPNECTECPGENDKACIKCPFGYTCEGGSVDCTAYPAIPLIKPGNIDYDPLTAPIYTIDACSPGMKKTAAGQCAECLYDDAERNMYCFNGTPENHVMPTTADDIKLKNNDNFTPAIYITDTDNSKTYNIYTITQDSQQPNDIVFTFKSNYIPAYIDSYSEEDIESLKDTDVPLYLYEHASGERSGDEILDAKNVTQEAGVSITDNTINLLNEGYISNKETDNNIRTRIQSNNLKFTDSEKDELLDIVKLYKDDKTNGSISDDQNLSYIYEFEYYDGSQFRTQSYVYKILPYPSLCDEGTHSTSGLIGSCESCPIGTYKSDSSATLCAKATGNDYVGVNNQSDSAPDGLGGISIAEMPSEPGFEMLTTSDGGNYGYKLTAGYGYDATIGEPTPCFTGFNPEQILIDNTIDKRNNDYLCGSCPPVDSLDLSSAEKIGLSRLETDSESFSRDSTDCVIKVCDDNYTNTNGDSTEFCELEKCPVGYYFNETSCEVCPEGHYCNGDSTIIPSAESHPKIECPANTYNAFERKALLRDCLDCPPNTSTNTLLKQTALENCIANSGYYFDSSSTESPVEAEECPSGKYCPKGTVTPEDCPINTTSPAGSSSYTDCRAKAGWFYPWNSPSTNANTQATVCPYDTYCVGDDQTAAPCPLNTNTDGNDKNKLKSNCVSDRGYYYDVESHTNAQACPVGTYNPDTDTTSVDDCTKCPEDTYSDNTAVPTLNDCTGCPPNSSTAYDDAGNPVEAGVETTGKSQLVDCKPRKMYKINPENPSEMILKTGHTMIRTEYTCDSRYYFNDDSGECEICPQGHYCEGGPAVSGPDGAITLDCPTFSTSPAGSFEIDDCFPLDGYKEVGNTNVFVGNEGVKTDASGGVVFKAGSTTLVQCEPGYEGKTSFDLECQPCVDGTDFSTDGNVCSPCGTPTNTELVIRQCDTKNDIRIINKSLLRIESFKTDNIVTALELSDTITAKKLYTTYIIPKTNTYPNYKYFDTTTDDLYFIKLPITYPTLPVDVDATANIHSNVIDSDIIDNVIAKSIISTSSYLKIINFINTNTNDETDILNLCYFPNNDNGVDYDVYLLLPKCGCIPGTTGDNCLICQTDAGSGRQTFQPDYNQEECILVPANIHDDSYTIIRDSSTTYNIGVSLNAGWAMNARGISSLCAEDTYYASTTDITDQIVNNIYTTIDCTDCADGSGTQDRDPVTGATAISDCTVKFGYTETSPATTPATYEYDTGYGDDQADGIIDCLPGYYFDESTGTGTCMQCPAGYYCIGGVASNVGATTTPCPIGTYNSNAGSIDEDACILINKDADGRGYYGTMAGIDNSTHSSFVQCPDNTRINAQATTRTTDDCIEEIGWEKIPTVTSPGNDAYVVTLKSRYYIDQTTLQPACLPGTVISPGGECIDYSGALSYHYGESQRDTNTDNYYLSGKSNIPEPCTLKPELQPGALNSNHDLSKCDAYKDAYVVDMSSANVVDVLSDGLFIKCVTGYESINYESLDTFNGDPSKSDTEKAKIDNANEFYLYEYGSIYMNDMSSASAFWKVSDYYHLNTDPNVVSILKNAVEVDFKVTAANRITANDLGYIKAIIKSYKETQENLADIMQKVGYMLMFYNDVNVHNSSGPVTIRYIYKILNGCGQCSSGYTSNGYACYLNVCQSGEFYDGTSCLECPVGYYCPAGQTQISEEASGNWLPARTQCATKTYKSIVGAGDCIGCPPNTTSPLASTTADDCVPDAGYYGLLGDTATACGHGTYKPSAGLGDANSCTGCPGNTSHTSTASTTADDCVPDAGYYGLLGDTATPCGKGTYKPSAGLGDANSCTDCPGGTSSPPKSTTQSDCIARPGFYGLPGDTATACGVNTYNESSGATDVTSCLTCPTGTSHTQTGVMNPWAYCLMNDGYYGTDLFSDLNRCPGVDNPGSASYNNIKTTGTKELIGDCYYDPCGDGKFRNSQLQCTDFDTGINNESCAANEIFIAGAQVGIDTRYSAYNPGMESNYDNTDHLYGHDNLCLAISEVCTS